MNLYLHMTKPLQSASPQHICNAFNSKPTVVFCTCHSTLQIQIQIQKSLQVNTNIHLTIIHSNVAIFSTFTAQVLLAYLTTLNTGPVHLTTLNTGPVHLSSYLERSSPLHQLWSQFHEICPVLFRAEGGPGEWRPTPVLNI